MKALKSVGLIFAVQLLCVFAAAQSPKTEIVHQKEVGFVAFSPDGKSLVTQSANTIYLWNKKGQFLKTLHKDTQIIASVAFSPDSKLLATGGWDKTVKLWDVSSGTNLKTFSHTSFVGAVGFSPDSKVLISGDWDGQIKMWEVASGREIKTIAAKNAVNAVAFTSDGKTLAYAADTKITLFDISSGQTLRALSGHSLPVDDLRFTPTGRVLVSDGAGTIKIWDAAAGAETKSLKHKTIMTSIALSPDGKLLATGDKNQVKLWDVPSGAEISAFSPHTESVYSIAFSPDGKSLATASADKTVKLWEVSKILKAK